MTSCIYSPFGGDDGILHVVHDDNPLCDCGSTPAAPVPVEMKPIDSSTIKAIGYNPLTKVLSVDFKRGEDRYHYKGVPPAEYASLLAAPSPGKYLAASIKGKFEFTKTSIAVPEPPPGS